MNLFECTLASGSGKQKIIVTCDSAFAGLTISCTDGTKTLTAECPGTSPYTIEFIIPNDGTWTISGTISGVTYSESIIIPVDVALSTLKEVTVDFYSAAKDIVSYTGLDAQTHTIATDASGHAFAKIIIDSNGSSLTFTSSVAKNPTALSSSYTKTVLVTPSTKSIYLMPDNACYWYGNQVNCETLSTANGWAPGSEWIFNNPTYNTNSIYCSASSASSCGIGAKTAIEGNVCKAIMSGTRYVSAQYPLYGEFGLKNKKESGATVTKIESIYNTAVTLYTTSITDVQPVYAKANGSNGSICTIYALWVE